MRFAIADWQHAMQGQCGVCVRACLQLSQHETTGLRDCDYMSMYWKVQVCAGMIGGGWRLSANVRVVGCRTGVTKALHK